MYYNDSAKKNIIDRTFMFISLLCLWVPNSYSYILTDLPYTMVRWLQYGFAGIFVLFVIVTRKYDKMFWTILVFTCVLIFSTVIHDGNFNKCLNYVAPLIGTVSMITYYFSRGKARQLLTTMRCLLYLYFIANILTYFLYPNGLYVTELVTNSSEIHTTYLGNRNAYKFYGLLLIAVSYFEGLFREECLQKKRQREIGAILLAFIMECLGGSLTGIIVISLVGLYYVIGVLIFEVKIIRPKAIFFVSVGIFIFIIFFVSMGKYTSLISYLFNGNITFSNRIRIWMYTLNEIERHPFFGIGTISSKDIYALIRGVHAHNHYLEIALRGGVTALAVFLYSIWIAVKKMGLFPNKVVVSFLSICLFAALIINMMEVETYSFAVLSYLCAMIYSLGLLLDRSKADTGDSLSAKQRW